MGGLGPVAYQGFLVGGTCVCVLVDGDGSYLSESNAMSSSEFGGVYGFDTTCFLMFRVAFPVLLKDECVLSCTELVGPLVELGLSVDGGFGLALVYKCSYGVRIL